jgi:hypothetical protein
VDSIKGEITAYCYMVQRGKPAALLPVQERYKTEMTTLVEEYGLKAYVEPLTDGWFSLWIYRYPHVLEVIKSVPQAPKTVLDHWMLGKLFGYEESAIHEFLAKNQRNSVPSQRGQGGNVSS